ncbi:MAG: glycosyltransferase family 4 protein [Actinomycetota bacterium]|nr:glycosyltransferase family 4 protein [Actinomycetota bacterium]
MVYLDHCAKLSGAEIALARLLDALGDAVDPHVILGEDGPLVARLEDVGARVEVIEMPKRVATVTRNRVGSGLDPRAAARAAWYSARLVPVLRRLRPDLVHTNSLKAAFYGVPAARAAGVPAVWHLRDHITPDYMSATAVHLVRAAIRTLPTAVVANSTATLATVSRARRGSVVPNAVPLPALPDAVPRPAAMPNSRPLRIVVLGRLAYWKGQDVFLDAFAAAFPRGGATARIVGSAMFAEDHYEEQLRGQAKRLGIADRVEFCGFREDIWPELAASDVLVHCSRTAEPFGQVVIEGLGAGLAVIASDAGGPAEILTDGVDGVLVPPGDARALGAAMVRLGDRAMRERLSAAGRLTASAYSPARASANMLAVYRSLTRARSR